MQLFLKLITGMADSVDPDQTAPKGAVLSALYAYAILSDTLVYENLEHLSYTIRGGHNTNWATLQIGWNILPKRFKSSWIIYFA